jgi:hypothetical protein
MPFSAIISRSHIYMQVLLKINLNTYYSSLRNWSKHIFSWCRRKHVLSLKPWALVRRPYSITDINITNYQASCRYEHHATGEGWNVSTSNVCGCTMTHIYYFGKDVQETFVSLAPVIYLQVMFVSQFLFFQTFMSNMPSDVTRWTPYVRRL